MTLYRLSTRIEMNTYVQPITLPDHDTLLEYTTATVIGWGGILAWVSLMEKVSILGFS